MTAQVLEELLEQLAGKAVVKEALQSLVPVSTPAQPPQLAIPLKGLLSFQDTSFFPVKYSRSMLNAQPLKICCI
jgi:hypothetical protein